MEDGNPPNCINFAVHILGDTWRYECRSVRARIKQVEVFLGGCERMCLLYYEIGFFEMPLFSAKFLGDAWIFDKYPIRESYFSNQLS